MVGIRPLGLRARYAGVSTTPKAIPASMRLKGRFSSAQHHSTFWTLIEFVRPQILSMLHLSRYDLVGAPPLRKGARVVPAMVRIVEPLRDTTAEKATIGDLTRFSLRLGRPITRARFPPAPPPAGCARNRAPGRARRGPSRARSRAHHRAARPCPWHPRARAAAP